MQRFVPVDVHFLGADQVRLALVHIGGKARAAGHTVRIVKAVAKHTGHIKSDRPYIIGLTAGRSVLGRLCLIKKTKGKHNGHRQQGCYACGSRAYFFAADFGVQQELQQVNAKGHRQPDLGPGTEPNG